MSIAFLLLLIVHGLIHSMGFLKAFGLAALPQLAGPISRPLGALWLLSMLAMLATAVLYFVAPRWWWVVGGAALVLSQGVIFASWGDAKFGTLANAIVLVAVVFGFFSTGPTSLSADYRRETERGLARLAEPAEAPERLVTEQDLARLPPQVGRYLRLAGVVGHPRVRSYRVKFTGRIRAAADKPWMEFTAEQHSFVDRPTRLFFMRARMMGLPVSVLHMYFGEQASMQAKVLSMVPMLDVRGRELAAAETVTHFNDLCILAPAALLDPAIGWEDIDSTHVRATFAAGSTTIRATLVFNQAGELVDFVSDDRSIVLPDGSFKKQRWTTPLHRYGAFGPYRLTAYGEAVHHPASGEYTYGQFEIREVIYNDPSSRPMD